MLRVIVSSLLFFVTIMVAGCKRHHIYICDPDEEQCITVIDPAYSDIRYVINGKHLSVPDTNFVKLKISTGEFPLDGIYICWKNETYRWEVVVTITKKVLENKLDKDRYLFSSKLDEDERGIPTAEKFTQKGCANIGFEDGYRIVPKNHAIVINQNK